MLQAMVGAVTCQATDPAITRIETFAFCQAIRLEADRQHSLDLYLFHVGPRAVEGTAEFHLIARFEAPGTENVQLP
jgi:hypothetical protein